MGPQRTLPFAGFLRDDRLGLLQARQRHPRSSDGRPGVETRGQAAARRHPRRRFRLPLRRRGILRAAARDERGIGRLLGRTDASHVGIAADCRRRRMAANHRQFRRRPVLRRHANPRTTGRSGRPGAVLRKAHGPRPRHSLSVAERIGRIDHRKHLRRPISSKASKPGTS